MCGIAGVALRAGQRPDPVTEVLSDGITTISYPEQKRPYPERFRGLHRLMSRESGDPRCVACLCRPRQPTDYQKTTTVSSVIAPAGRGRVVGS